MNSRCSMKHSDKRSIPDAPAITAAAAFCLLWYVKLDDAIFHDRITAIGYPWIDAPSEFIPGDAMSMPIRSWHAIFETAGNQHGRPADPLALQEHHRGDRGDIAVRSHCRKPPFVEQRCRR